ncbi:hypothetical protein POM88_015707 [Heracleum sosnowskyi]|uniref:Glutamyl/glutaminyl-tRNA synthetase class Ib catalytic domain-containing protein n=1 Tax=Heracleum sosnowskyi TaxID=360622 RepID=A0AAD8MWG1_9APIA|nr:hypothetical protein POM88_015707 [Heracleum sosnowskyi]
MVYTLLSKHKLMWFVKNGKVDEWDDPRFPTVQGIVRRGLQIEELIQFILEQEEEVTLMDWGNDIVNEISKDDDGRIKHLKGVLNLKGSVKRTKLKLTWLPHTNELVPLSLVEFDYLIKKKKLDEDEDFVDVLNPCTKKEIAAFGDSNISVGGPTVIGPNGNWAE